MRILVTTAHPQCVKHAGPGFGRLIQPRHYPRIYDTAQVGIPWAADNDCFQGLDATAFRKMLNAIWGLPGCLFVAAPDVVGDWQQTRERFEEWYDELNACLQPVAYVLQDGQPSAEVPWQRIAAVFVGGSTEFKLSAEAELLVREARTRGLYVHMGRVNSRKRFDYARQIGCDSVDGTSFSRWRDRWLPDAVTWHLDHLQERIPA